MEETYMPRVIRATSKPCPICGRTISANKELCLDCFTKHGSLAEYLAKMAPPEPEKKTRKPRAKKEVTVDIAPEAKPARKPRTKKVVVA
jgi:hypothetical protein